MSFFGKTDVQGTIYLALALFLAVALMSYHPLDPSLNTLGEEPVRNYCGYIGAFLSDLMYQIFGLTAWLLVIASLKRSFISFAGKANANLQTHLIEVTLLCSVCAFAILLWPNTRFFQDHITTGGIIGQMIISGLTPLIHETGVAIVLSSALVCCLMAQSHRPARFYVQSVFHLLASLSVGLKNVCFNIFKNLRNKAIELPPVTFNQESEEELHFDGQDVSLLPKEQDEPLITSQPSSGQWKSLIIVYCRQHQKTLFEFQIKKFVNKHKNFKINWHSFLLQVKWLESKAALP